MELSTVETIVGLATAVASSLGAVFWWMRRRVWYPARKWFSEVHVAVKQIVSENGVTLSDRLTQIDLKVDEVRARAEAMVNLEKNAIYECDTDGRCVTVNKALCDLFGLDYSDVIGNGWLAALDSSARASVLENWLNAVKKGIPYDCEYTVVNGRTGKKTKCRSYAKAMISSSGKIFGYTGVVVPIKGIGHAESNEQS